MAGKIEEHGQGYRVRWRHPDLGRRFSYPLDDVAEAKRFKIWVEERGNRVHRNDDALMNGTWDVNKFEIRQGLAGSAITFGEYFTNCNRLRDARESSVKQDHDFMKLHLEDWFPLPLTSITRARLEQKVEALKKAKKIKGNGTEPYAPSTINKVLVLLKMVLTNAHGAGLIAANPFVMDAMNGKREIDPAKASGYDRKKRLRKARQIRLSRTEREKLYAAARKVSEQTYVMLWLLIETGCRIGEVLALQVGDVYIDNEDADDNFIEVQYTRLRDGNLGPPKARSEREIAITAALAEKLRPYALNRPSDAALFRSPKRRDEGWTYQSWHKWRWQKALRIAKDEFNLSPTLSLHLHALRYNNITHSSESGKVQDRDISLNAGHTRGSTTRGYDMGGPQGRARMRTTIIDLAPEVEVAS